MSGVRERLSQLGTDEASYLPLLRQLLNKAADAVPGELIAQLNGRDRQRLAAGWEAFCREAVPGRRIALAEDVLEVSGGVMIYDATRNVRVDNTFEGRMERQQAELERVVMERLFASVAHMGALFGG
jgi:V/A-type H+-transporting ATPase subunit E